jgi:hypothetical protein
MKKTNYKITRDRMRPEFLKYDHGEMIRKFSLEADSDYIYIAMLGRPHRINRANGTVEWSEDGFATVHEADFNVSMTIYDVLCKSKPKCASSGVFCSVYSLGNQLHSVFGSGEFHNSGANRFAGDTDALHRACRKLGGREYFAGDIAYILPLFDFLPIVFQYWLPDDEFDAGITFLWDENALDFMHFETTFYASGHILQRLTELMGL